MPFWTGLHVLVQGGRLDATRDRDLCLAEASKLSSTLSNGGREGGGGDEPLVSAEFSSCCRGREVPHLAAASAGSQVSARKTGKKRRGKRCMVHNGDGYGRGGSRGIFLAIFFFNPSPLRTRMDHGMEVYRGFFNGFPPYPPYEGSKRGGAGADRSMMAISSTMGQVTGPRPGSPGLHPPRRKPPWPVRASRGGCNAW